MNPPTHKEWCHAEAERAGIKPRSVSKRLQSGFYRLNVQRINARVIFVLHAEQIRNPKQRDRLGIIPTLNGTIGKERHRRYMALWRHQSKI